MFEHLVSEKIFFQLAVLTFLSAVAGVVAQRFRQPLILAFIFVGVIAGPQALGIVQAQQLAPLEALSEMGIAILLFMVGLKLDVPQIRCLGVPVIIAGVAQVVLTTLAGAAVCSFMGYEWRACLLIGFVLSFSSTIIVVKLLSDQRRLDSLYGRIALGILIMQDIIVILATVVFGAVGVNGMGADLWAISVKIVGVVCAMAVLSRLCARKVCAYVAQSPELMIVFAMGFAGMTASVCGAIGLSRELGGLLAGIALASSPLQHVLFSRLTTLRDFLLLFFFLSLGMHLDLESLRAQAVLLAVLSLFVLLVKPAIVVGIMHAMGYRPRTGFMTGVSLGQISEFSLILAAMMSAAGQVGAQVPNVITGLALVTTGLSTSLIAYSDLIFEAWEKRFGNRSASPAGFKGEMDTHERKEDAAIPEVVLIGLGRYGSALGKYLMQNGVRVLGVDFDPEAARLAERQGMSTLYGDASDPDFLSQLPLTGVKAIVFSFHHAATGPVLTDLRRTLAGQLRAAGYKGHIATTSHHDGMDGDLGRHGIDIIFRPFDDAAFSAAQRVLTTIR